MPAPVLLRHASSLDHDPGPHPEQPARIVAIERELERRGPALGWEPRDSSAATREVLETIHPPEHVTFIEELSASGGGQIDLDTAVSRGSWAAACHAVGGACDVVDLLLGEEGHRVAASAHRPPGHHAEPAQAMGFCLFANIAIAAQRALDVHGLSRVLVLDWDVHHGNGTNDIFRDTDRVLFASIHGWPLYPGTGPVSDTGTGAGDGYTVNLPVPAGSGDEAWVSLVEHVVRPLARAYAPELVLVSAGYDAHADDPLAACRVTDAGFAAMTASSRLLAEDVGAPLGIVLEGGYDLDSLARCFADTLEVAGADASPATPEVPLHPRATEALARLVARWPALAGLG
jgi:acetoin utilization deacetylase AcuC-like enzyme